MKKLISLWVSLVLIASAFSSITVVKADGGMTVAGYKFTHQNIVGSQTCYGDDAQEKEISTIPDVYQGMRINRPVFKAYLTVENDVKGVRQFLVKQLLSSGKVLQEETITKTVDAGQQEVILEFPHVRNAEKIEIYYNGQLSAQLDAGDTFINGVKLTSAPMDYQIYQRNAENQAEIILAGAVSKDVTEVKVNGEEVPVLDGIFTYKATQSTGFHDYTVTSNLGKAAYIQKVGVGDLWVAAGQSNMTDMGASTDGFNPDRDDPINENMHIIYPESCKWEVMTHPAGEGRFFKAGVRTSPVTSFAREIAASENIPVGIVQASVGGTNLWQWVDGIRNDPNSGYLFDALKACFDKMPSANVTGILWYQGCNDATNENYAYNYKNLQDKIFAQMRAFFGEHVPIITTQLNDANQDNTAQLGYYDAWSYVKDVQRQNDVFYDEIYVVGTGELELGDTIHNNAASNIKLGKKWANAAKHIVYGKEEIPYQEASIEKAEITGANEIVLSFKNTDGLALASGAKRIGITNAKPAVSIGLGDLKKEFVVRSGGAKVMTASNSGKGTILTVTEAEIMDGKKVKLTTAEELSGVVAVDCMYGKRFTPTLVDAKTKSSVLSFYNVIAQPRDTQPEASPENSSIEPVLSANKTTVTVTAGAAIQDAALMMASYRDGQLLGVTVQEITLEEKQTRQFPARYQENSDVLKIFLWESTQTLIPLCTGVTVDLTEVSPTTAPTVKPTPTTEPTPTPTVLPGKHYTFGTQFQLVKAFDTQFMAETAIGNTGFKVSTNTTTNYNNVVVMSNTDKANGTGYYPYGDGLITNQYYLFFGGGGNSGSSLTLTLPETAKAGQYIAVNYAKPYATNNGTINRSAGNACTMSAGGETVDIEGSCEYDLWHTSTIKVSGDVQTLQFELGKWSAVAIESVSILEEADMLQLSAENNAKEKYIGASNETVQYTANVYQSITVQKDTGKIAAVGSNDETARVTYSVNGYSGVSIDDKGLLTITPSAKAGTVTITAAYGSILKTATLTLLEVGDADGVQVYGEELAAAGSSAEYKAIPSAKGSIIPARATQWSIEGETLGCTIKDGLLTVPANAKGTIQLKATLKVEGKQTTPNISDVLTVTVGTTEGVLDIEGAGLKNGLTEVSKATGVEMVALKQKDENISGSYQVVLKAFGGQDELLAQSKTPVTETKQGIQSAAAALDFEKASYIKAYVVNQDSEVISSKIAKLERGIYKNLPVRADWLVGKDGSSVMEGSYSPANGVVPSGVNPDVVDTEKSNANYTYDQNYPAVTSKNVLWYKTGAYDKNSNIYQRDSVDWEKQALPVGNGYMGAMVFGMPAKDHIQFNEETFWGSGYNGHQDTNSQWSNLLNAVKTKTTGYSTTELNTYYRNNTLMGEAINGFMNTGNLFVDFGLPQGTTVNNYYRDLNLDEGVSHVQYELDGTTYHREYFASYPDEVVAVHYSADKANALSFDVNFVSAHPGEISVNNGEITVVGNLKDSEPYNSGGKSIWAGESVLEYCDKIKVVADGGTVTDEYGNVRVEKANEVTIYMTAATDYDPEAFGVGSDGFLDGQYKTQLSNAQAQEAFKSSQGVQFAIDKASKRLQNVQGKSYAEVKSNHVADYKSLFDRVEFHLTGEDEICDVPTNELVSSYTKVVSAEKNGAVDNSPANNEETQHYTIQYNTPDYENLNKHLEELHYNFARYLMISSSRAKSLPATLQGKWNQSVAEIWGSCYCININFEMNYWMVGGSNLADDSGIAFVQWLKEQIPAAEITAYSTYDIKNETGKPEDDVFVMHTKQSILGTTDMTGGGNIYHIGNSAWLMQNIWDIYQTTGDKAYLASDIYPIMRASANFYKKYMENFKTVTTDTDTYSDGYYYTTGPARSPEHGPMETGTKYDLQLIASMFDYTIEAAGTLGIDSGKVNEWREIRSHMQAPVEIGEDGQIKEWSTETKLAQNASGKQIGGLYHRHMSQLVGLYPGELMTRKTPEFLEAAKVSLNARGDNATGWSVSNRFLMWARCLDGDKALELFRFQLAQKTYSNLFDYHAPFQIDGNLGSAAGVMELLMQSQTGEIYILPALPSVWKEGSISGIKAKNGATVSIAWKDGKATKIEITPVTNGDFTIGYQKDNTLQLDGMDVLFTDGLYTVQNAVKGTTYTFTAK